MSANLRGFSPRKRLFHHLEVGYTAATNPPNPAADEEFPAMAKQQQPDEQVLGNGGNRIYIVPRFIWLSRLPDHMPHHPGDRGNLQAYAFGYGYINALINAANSEVSQPLCC
jgi:hypothetical protein